MPRAMAPLDPVLDQSALVKSLHNTDLDSECLTILQTQVLKSPAAKRDMLPMRCLKSLVPLMKSEDGLKNLMYLFVRMMSDVMTQLLKAKDKSQSAEAFALVKDFWALCFCQHNMVQCDVTSERELEFIDVIPSLASLYLDLAVCLHGEESQPKKKVSHRLHNLMFFDLNPRCLKAALLEMSQCSAEGAQLLKPLLRKLLLQPLSESQTALDYLQHIVALRRWTLVSDFLTERSQIVQLPKPPSKFVPWLSQRWLRAADYFPLDKSLKGRRVTEVMLSLDKAAVEELIDVFSECLWSEKSGGSQVEETSQEVPMETDLEDQLFVIDKTGAADTVSSEEPPPTKKRKAVSRDSQPTVVSVLGSSSEEDSVIVTVKDVGGETDTKEPPPTKKRRKVSRDQQPAAVYIYDSSSEEDCVAGPVENGVESDTKEAHRHRKTNEFIDDSDIALEEDKTSSDDNEDEDIEKENNGEDEDDNTDEDDTGSSSDVKKKGNRVETSDEKDDDCDRSGDSPGGERSGNSAPGTIYQYQNEPDTSLPRQSLVAGHQNIPEPQRVHADGMEVTVYTQEVEESEGDQEGTPHAVAQAIRAIRQSTGVSSPALSLTHVQLQSESEGASSSSVTTRTKGTPKSSLNQWMRTSTKSQRRSRQKRHTGSSQSSDGEQHSAQAKTTPRNVAADFFKQSDEGLEEHSNSDQEDDMVHSQEDSVKRISLSIIKQAKSPPTRSRRKSKALSEPPSQSKIKTQRVKTPSGSEDQGSNVETPVSKRKKKQLADTDTPRRQYYLRNLTDQMEASEVVEDNSDTAMTSLKERKRSKSEAQTSPKKSPVNRRKSLRSAFK